MTSRRTIADLRALCKSQDDTGRNGETFTWLGIDWDDHRRARRLEDHGWVQDAHHDAGEGYIATLTETGEAIREEWREAGFDELAERLDPDAGGGVGVFCDEAVAKREELCEECGEEKLSVEAYPGMPTWDSPASPEYLCDECHEEILRQNDKQVRAERDTCL